MHRAILGMFDGYDLRISVLYVARLSDRRVSLQGLTDVLGSASNRDLWSLFVSDSIFARFVQKVGSQLHLPREISISHTTTLVYRHLEIALVLA
jgi:hypothetical protein